MPKRLRNQDFPTPKKIEDTDWNSLCETSRVPSEHRRPLKERAAHTFDGIATRMEDGRKQPDRKSDRARVKDMLAKINQVADTARRLGPSGDLTLKAISPLVAPMLAARWMNENFPNDIYTPQRSIVPEWDGRYLGDPFRSPEYFIEEVSLEARMQFVHQNPAETLVTALEYIEGGLNNALRAFDLEPRSRGGQERLLYRHYAIIDLIKMWDEIGLEPSSGPNSNFATFCELVASSIGWPTQGMVAAIPDALKHWRHLTGKIVR